MWLSQTQFSVLWDAVPGLCGCAAIKVWQNAILVLKLDLRSAKGTCGLVGKDVWDWFCAGFRASESCWAQEAVTVRPRHADLSLYLLAEQANSPLTFRKLLPCSLGILLELSQTSAVSSGPTKVGCQSVSLSFLRAGFLGCGEPWPAQALKAEVCGRGARSICCLSSCLADAWTRSAQGTVYAASDFRLQIPLQVITIIKRTNSQTILPKSLYERKGIISDRLDVERLISWHPNIRTALLVETSPSSPAACLLHKNQLMLREWQKRRLST